MKYYVYVSDAKVDMLLPQIPQTLKKKIATEFKIDLKILGASRRTEVEEADNRFTRLEAVCNYIREYGNVGSVDEPDEYVSGSLVMRWGPIAVNPASPEESVVVYFAGETESTVVGLGGSMKHVIGSSAPLTPRPGAGGSMTMGLMIELAKALKLRATPKELFGPSLGNFMFSKVADKQIEWPQAQDSEKPYSLASVKARTEDMEGPEQHLEFLAKRLMYGPPAKEGDKAMLLATPLYVAMAE